MFQFLGALLRSLYQDSCARQKATRKHLGEKFQAREFPAKEPYVPLSKRLASLTYFRTAAQSRKLHLRPLGQKSKTGIFGQVALGSAF
ncbi:hypothetical protein YK48G_18280 [Lentilactobacillus fungorum]|uniref:Uncharacterized protein n=1 Tax=Lentilactobacillus fungorum TaxID=2201250 RepID=A0ABQ3VZR8_9LACO|nr:hypothetical protein YK48G_18280 [Lentilactobacillus fungorum]